MSDMAQGFQRHVLLGTMVATELSTGERSVALRYTVEVRAAANGPELYFATTDGDGKVLEKYTAAVADSDTLVELATALLEARDYQRGTR
jgi:hypothetical protein